jgi:hypothetical protein
MTPAGPPLVWLATTKIVYEEILTSGSLRGTILLDVSNDRSW